MEEQYKILLNHLYKVEGGVLHRNSEEFDITNAYGIYRHFHPKAEIFTYIDTIASSVTRAPSNKWTKEQIVAINKLIDKNKELELSYRFYREYFKSLNIVQFPPSLVLSIVDCFTNTQVGTYKAIQEALNDCHKYGLFKHTPISKTILPNKDDILLVDGKFGNGSKAAMKDFVNRYKGSYEPSSWKDELIFKNCMLLYMKTHYAELVLGNSNHTPNLRGWNHRMENAQHV